MPRFDMDANTRDGARAYLEERAYQALRDGFRPVSDDVEPLSSEDHIEWGARALARSRDGEVHQSIYVYAHTRGAGRLSRYLHSTTTPVVTIADCHIEEYLYLAARGVRFVVIGRATQWKEYAAIEAFYGTRRATRSGVPFMHHIDEGLALLDRIGASERAARAFCLHPLVQRDEDLARTFAAMGEAPITDDASVLALALEYRNVANATLSSRAITSAADIALSPLDEISHMLIADKVQNRKDFILHHRATHARSRELDRYFALWLERLGVSESLFAKWFVELQVTSSPVAYDS